MHSERVKRFFETTLWPLMVVIILSCPVRASLVVPQLEPPHSSQTKSFKDLPPSAAPAIIRAMQKDLPGAYQLKNDGMGFSMSNPSQGLGIIYTADGPQINTGNGSWGMTLSGFGYQSAIKPVKKSLPTNDDGRVVYDRGEVSEWYVNSRWGIEQGFTIFNAPEKKQGLLVVELAISGELQPSLDGDTLVFSDASDNILCQYSGLKVFDANEAVLPAQLTLTDNTLRILVDDNNAHYPVTIDPWIQAAKLTARNRFAFDDFGRSVSISGDIIVVGAPGDDDRGYSYGSVYVFERPSGDWFNMNQVAKLVASDGAAYDFFGKSVSISGDAIVVGAWGDDDSGSAYVFERPPGGWVDMPQTSKLTASDGVAGDHFGFSVSISGDTIVVGGYRHDNKTGSVYVFEKNLGGMWPQNATETGKLTVSDGAEPYYFGESVSISEDTIVVGSPSNKSGLSNFGSAYVFKRPDGGWVNMTHTASLSASDGAEYDSFGYTVSISGDTIVVGAPNNDDSASAYVFERPSGGWVGMTQTAKISAGDAASDDSFGFTVSISGGVIVVGAPAYRDSFSQSGSAYVFEAAAALPMTINCSTQQYLPFTECYRLVDLYDATNGSGWTDQGNWMTNTNPCTAWGGITCREFTEYTPTIPPVPYTVNRVTEINLYNRGLSGTIPSSLGALPQLEWLSLRNNMVGGEIPSLLGNLSNLTHLYLDDNRLWGEIPEQLGNLTNLEYLYLDNNQLTDVVPLGVAEAGAATTNCDFRENNFCIPNTPEYTAIGADPICNVALSSSCLGQCGDSLIALSETCDDGNTVNGDGCSDTCDIETDWTCSGTPSNCTPACVSAGPDYCDDANICTNDSCDASTGCTYTNNILPCNDGDACSTNDVCIKGACTAGPALDCNDGNICTNDSCYSRTGCTHSNNTLSCNDGDFCSTNDVCSSGICVAGPALNCNDSNSCTADSCDPAAGCLNQCFISGEDDPCCSNSVCSYVSGCGFQWLLFVPSFTK